MEDRMPHSSRLELPLVFLNMRRKAGGDVMVVSSQLGLIINGTLIQQILFSLCAETRICFCSR
jgi:hypothetical protein